jgi:phosphatidylserine/phosphatidylglycerophosphate/cardiolipin synthase-like enzyme
MNHKISLIVQPGDSFFPIVRAIDRAQRSINLTVFRMDDPIIQRALLEACKRGVRIRVLISSNARGWEEKNRKVLKDATKAGIATKEPESESKSARYHYKTMTVDDKEAFVFTFNPTRQNLHYARDFGIELHNPAVASEINRLFDADWDDTPFKPDKDSPLLISPYNSRSKMEELLGGARESIRMADAKLEDPEIIRLLVKKARAGISVRILGDERHRVKLPPEFDFRAEPRYKMHAKCTIVDGKVAVIGSMSLRTVSLDRRRELCIMVDNTEILKQLHAVFKNDWDKTARTPRSDATLIVKAQDLHPIEPVELPSAGFVLISRTDALARHALKEGVTSIGRAAGNGIVIDNAQVSRHHAEISLKKDRCTITDLGSGNGTFVNGERIDGTTPLSPGDVVNFARTAEFRLLEL